METAPKVRIKLKSFDHRLLDKSTFDIVDTVKRTGAKVAGPIPLPTHISRTCVLRAPHVYKDSREHFEVRTQKRKIETVLQTFPVWSCFLCIFCAATPQSSGSIPDCSKLAQSADTRTASASRPLPPGLCLQTPSGQKAFPKPKPGVV